MPSVRLRTALEVILGLALVASIALNLRQSRRLATSVQDRAADQQTIRTLRETLLERDHQKTPAISGGLEPEIGGPVGLAKRDATIKQLNAELTEVKATLAQVQSQFSICSEEQEKALAGFNERYLKGQKEWQGRLDGLIQELENAQAEAQASRHRVDVLEADIAKLRSSVSSLSSPNAELRGIIGDLQDLDRRREGHLSSIMRRYRDITSQFRSMRGMLDSSRDANCSALSGAGLTDMQNAVTLADDDLRQLNELNTRARQLETKLTKELNKLQGRPN